MMNKRKNAMLVIVFISSLLTITSASAASFDCKKAGSLIEHTICNDDKLSKYDEELSRAYKNAERNTDPKDLKRDQLQWMKEVRGACKDVDCLRDTYIKRISQLNKYRLKQITLRGRIAICSDVVGKGYCVQKGTEQKMVVYFYECDEKRELCAKLSKYEEEDAICDVTGKIDGDSEAFSEVTNVERAVNKAPKPDQSNNSTSNAEAKEFDIYLLAKGQCKSLKEYGLKSGNLGYQQFTQFNECSLVGKNQELGYVQLQCKKLANLELYMFTNYEKCMWALRNAG